MPLYRRLPKRGFHNINSIHYDIVNVSTLEKFYEDGSTVTITSLKAKGIVKNVRDGVKILGDGEITKKLVVQANAFSGTAKEKIEAAGGKAEVV
jgi:large subunit ribosomal protein L15